MNEEIRGKRRLANILLLGLGVMVFWGFFNDTVKEEARFYAALVFPSAIGLYAIDGYFHNSRVRQPSTEGPR